jgi:diguanylate cyclase (GGDEF)-like protein
MSCELYDTDIEGRASAPEIAELLAAYRALPQADGAVSFVDLRERAPRAAACLAVLEPSGSGQLRCAVPAGEMTEADSGDQAEEIATFLREAYQRAFRERRPLLLIHHASATKHVAAWERLLLPCRTPDGHDGLAAFVRPRSYWADIYQAVLEASADGIVGLRALRDADGIMRDALIVTANQRAVDYIGRPRDALLGERVSRVMMSLIAKGPWERCRRVAEDKVTERFELACTFQERDTLLRVTATPVEDGLVLSFSDVTDLRYALIEMEITKDDAEQAREELAAEIAARQMVEGELRRIATTDALTGVLNRRGFEEMIQKETGLARRYGYPLSVIAVDIDHFKRVNDLHGHAAGDAVLRTVAMMFMQELRKDADAIGRVGGEEFMVLLPHTSGDGAIILAERLRQRLMKVPVAVADGSIFVTASFGVQELGTQQTAEKMMIEADDALYRAKRAGRNRTVMFSSDDSAAAASAD